LKAGKKMIKRERYLNQLIKKQWNGRIKIITGIRRCGKSTLLFDLFNAYLMNEGVNEEHVIAIALDDDQNDRFRSPDILSEHVRTLCADKEKKYYLFLDEIQYAISKAELRDKENPPRLYSVLNGLLHLKNVDVYVTGSNSKLLSKDVMTEFRGRGDVIHVYPLSFSEFYEASGLDKADAYNEYMTYGGMPYLLRLESENEKFQYLNELFEEIYFKDIEERYSIGLPQVLRELTTSLCSSVGSLTNASKIARAVNSHKTEKTNSETISSYLTYLTDSFLFSKAERYDVKGKRYFEYPSKYYCTDVGLRNIRLGLRQQEETHIMENLLYNELRVRGYQADVGVVNVTESNSDGKREQKGLEIDFVAKKGSQMVYIQSALRMDDIQKQDSELRSLKAVSDSFQKMVVSKSYGKRWTDENGILRIGLIDFLLDENCLQG
jgi:predicted AAA+ superfamily ATPase